MAKIKDYIISQQDNFDDSEYEFWRVNQLRKKDIDEHAQIDHLHYLDEKRGGEAKL